MTPHPGPTNLQLVSGPGSSTHPQVHTLPHVEDERHHHSIHDQVYSIYSGNLTSLSTQLAHVASTYSFDAFMVQEASVHATKMATQFLLAKQRLLVAHIAKPDPEHTATTLGGMAALARDRLEE